MWSDVVPLILLAVLFGLGWWWTFVAVNRTDPKRRDHCPPHQWEWQDNQFLCKVCKHGPNGPPLHHSWPYYNGGGSA